MTLEFRTFEAADAESWDSFCRSSHQGTLLHTRKFLSYHGTRFEDTSLIISENNKWLGILPAAIKYGDPRTVVSHPGATYGGIVQSGGLRGRKMIEALAGASSFYRKLGFMRFEYRPVPAIYQKIPSQDDLYALFVLAAEREKTDLSSTIALKQPRALAKRRQRCLNKAHNAGVTISDDMDNLSALWTILKENLQAKFGKAPVHSLDEISLLATRFPNEIECTVALFDEMVVAGILKFITETTVHAQYIATNGIGNSISALDMVIEKCIRDAESSNKMWFDFGISTEQNGTVLNDGLYKFKTEFGAGGTIHEVFTLDLKSDQLNDDF